MKASMNSVKFSRYLLAILFLIMFILGIFKVLQTYTTVDLGNLKLCATLRNLNKTFLLYNFLINFLLYHKSKMFLGINDIQKLDCFLSKSPFFISIKFKPIKFKKFSPIFTQQI